MAAEHKLSIFRGYLTFKSITQKIWGVLIFLSIVTLIEVILGIFKPQELMNTFLGMKLLNWIFIILTIIKAYYIAWDFIPARRAKKLYKLNCFATAYIDSLPYFYSSS